MLFGCVLITNTSGQMWSTVKNAMHLTMIASVDSMSQEEEIVFIDKCLNGPPINEWLLIDIALSWYVVVVNKTWYEKVRVEMSDDGG